MKKYLLTIAAAVLLLGPVMAEETKPAATPAVTPAAVTTPAATPAKAKHVRPAKKASIKRQKKAVNKVQ